MRILGLDFGDKTIGVAVSDPFGWTAQGVEIIRRENPMEFKKCMRRLAELVEQYQTETIVLGYPKNLDGSEGDRCVKTKDFCERVKRRFPKAEVLLWDERFSTIAAERSLREVGLNHNQRKSVIDKMADIYDEINDLEFEVVTMTDENGDAVEFSIIDNVACGGERYLLVVETELMDDDETDAIILKEVSINTDDVTYELVEDDAEFDRVADLFAQKAEDYTVETDD